MNSIKYLDELPPMGWVYQKGRFPIGQYRRKIIRSGSPLNPIDFKMRAKHNRKIVRPVVKYYEVVRV